jgi:hypothetical protein
MVSCVHVSDLSMGSGSLGGGALGDSPDGVAHASPSSERILRYFKGCQILIVSYRLPVRLFMTQGGAGPTGAVQVHPAVFVCVLADTFAFVTVVVVAVAAGAAAAAAVVGVALAVFRVMPCWRACLWVLRLALRVYIHLSVSSP